MPGTKVNYLAVLVAAAAHFAFGAIWYNVFSASWMAGAGLTAEMVEGNQSATPYVIAIVVLLIAALVLAWLIGRLNPQGAAGGARVGAIIAIGFVAAYQGLNYGFQMKPLSLWLIDAGYAVIGLVMMGAIIGGWRKKA
jgi:hypothetical protein